MTQGGMDPFDDGGGGGGDDGGLADVVAAPAAAAAPVSGGGEPGLLDLDDIFGGGGAAPAPALVAKQNGSSTAAAAPAKAQSDVDLLSDIFSAPPVITPAIPAPAGGGFDIFGQPPVQPMPPVSTNDLFAPTPVAAAVAPPAPMSAAGIIDPFAAPSPAPIAQQQPQQVTNNIPAATTPAGASTAASVGGPSPSETTVQGFSYGGLTVTFTCTKPDTWNKQNSLLVAKFANTTDAPLYGLHLQVAVPRYVTMEMKPPTSTTVPVTSGRGREVTQTISVTNTQLGNKNLMLKLKASFTSKGAKVEHMTTCSGFPVGQF